MTHLTSNHLQSVPLTEYGTIDSIMSLSPSLSLAGHGMCSDIPELLQAKRAFTTRRVDWAQVHSLVKPERTPKMGDLVLARVDSLGHHKGIQLASGRRATLYEGDIVALCYGNRYAPDQFEAEIPENLGPCHMVAAGGLAGLALSSHRRMSRPTAITPLGLLADANGDVISIDRFALPVRSPLIGSIGKTTAASALIHAHAKAGLRVGAAKVTGTGAFADPLLYLDNGAATVVDFTDAGLPSTYKAPIDQLETVFHQLVDELSARGVDVIVVEVADGLLQEETAALLKLPSVQERVTDVLFAAADALSAIAGANWLDQEGLPISGLSGAFTASTLACREAAQTTGRGAFTINELRAGALNIDVDPALALAS